MISGMLLILAISTIGGMIGGAVGAFIVMWMFD